MVPLRKRTNNWAGFSCSSARILMKHCAGQRRFLPQPMARLRSAHYGRRNPDIRSEMTARAEIENTFREEHGRVLAALINQLEDFELAEDALQDSLVNALEHWGVDGVPRNPGAWLLTVAKRRAIDRIRHTATLENTALLLDPESFVAPQEEPEMDDSIPDERLKLMFTCCHPALALEAQVALTLRTLGGLSTEEVARAFLVPVATMAQRLARARKKIREAGIPYRVPPADLLPESLDALLGVIYLIFNEGYVSTRGDT